MGVKNKQTNVINCVRERDTPFIAIGTLVAVFNFSRPAKEPSQLLVVSGVTAVTERVSLTLDPNRQTFGSVYRLRDRKCRIGSKLNALARSYHSHLHRKLRLKDFSAKRQLETVDNTI